MINENIKISIIVTVYNNEKYLKKCITSILNQSLKEIEIIIINDGSKDNSHKICNYFKDKDKRILYINKKNEGCSVSRNIGINIAKGEYITFVDSDDYIEKKMYEDMYKLSKENNLDIVICGFNRLDKEYKLVEKFNPEEYFNKIEYLSVENKCFNSPCNKLYKNKILKENNILFPINIHMGEDMVFNVKAFYFSEKIKVIKKCYYNYYLNTSSVMNNIERKKDIYKSLDEIFIFLVKKEENIKIFNSFYIAHGIKLIYGTIENLKIKKNKNWKILLKISEINLKKYYKKLGLKEKIYIYYRKVRLNFYFLKPFLKKYMLKNKRKDEKR